MGKRARVNGVSGASAERERTRSSSPARLRPAISSSRPRVIGASSSATEPRGRTAAQPLLRPRFSNVRPQRSPGPPPGLHWTRYHDDGEVWWYYEGPLGKWW